MKKLLESIKKYGKAILSGLLAINALLLCALLLVFLSKGSGPAAGGNSPALSYMEPTVSIATPALTPSPDTARTPTPSIQQKETPSPLLPPATADPRIVELHNERRKISGNIAAGAYSFALKADGTVLQAGYYELFGSMDASRWRDITAISAKDAHMVGLYSDGTVVAKGMQSELGEDYYGVGSWRDVVAVSAGYAGLTLGLKADGTVYSCGIIPSNPDLTDISDWNDIVAIAAGRNCAIGLKSDGTVVAAGDNSHGQCNVSGWRDIIGIAAGRNYTAGLRSDGTVVIAGQSGAIQTCTKSWKNIVEISAGRTYIAGLTADGIVVVATESGPSSCCEDWKDIIAIATGTNHVLGLKADGTLVAAGENQYGQCEVGAWTDLATKPLSKSDLKKTWEELQADAYYRLFLDLYDADKALNHEIKYLAVNMKGVELKDTSGLEKMFQNFCYRNSLTLLLSDYNQLKKDGYLSDSMYFKDGILINYEDTMQAIAGYTLIVKASKWRSGLGAIGGIYKLSYDIRYKKWSITCLDSWIS